MVWQRLFRRRPGKTTRRAFGIPLLHCPAQVAEESAPSANESEEVIMTQLVRHTTNTAERRKAEKKARAARRAEQDSGRHKVDTAEKRAAERR